MKSQLKNRKRTKVSRRYKLAPLRSYSNYENFTSFLEPHKYLTLKYSDTISQSLATVTATDQIFNMNSIFDPDRTGTGHQPYGRDTLAEFYNRYRVWDFRWKVTFHAESQGFYVLTVPTNGNLATAITNQASFSGACEVPNSKGFAQGTGANAIICKGKLALNDLNGTSPYEYRSDDRFQAIMTSNPSELLLFHIGTYNPSGSTVAIDFLVELEYDVEVFDPIILAQS
jgi:hypothetical protein